MRHFRRSLCWSVACLLMAAAGQAWAWGAQGHRIAGHIAYAELTPAAKAAVEKILGEASLASASTWMDDVRDQPIGKKMMAWHFDDLSVCQAQEAPCENGNCAHAQIAQALDTLRQSQDPQQRQESLRVLVHLVEDIHQPLHAADNHDQGGNQITLRNRLQCKNYKTKAVQACNLHQYWDSTLLRNAVGGSEAAAEKDYAARLAVRYPRPAGDSLEPAAWIAQSHNLGKEVAYGQLPGFACSHSGPFSTRVSKAYDKAASQTVEQQLALAGQRLAAILNGVFSE